MRGVTDDEGEWVAEDAYDAMLAEARRDEPVAPLEEFAARLFEEGRLPA